jgi:DNA-binding transcriptional MerR regulator
MLHLKIGDLARRTQCPAQTIRYYERADLLPRTTHTAGNYRVYGPAHIERLSLIRNCRFLDMTLDEIRQLLRARDIPHENCEESHRLLDEHNAHVGTRVPEFAGS